MRCSGESGELDDVFLVRVGKLPCRAERRMSLFIIIAIVVGVDFDMCLGVIVASLSERRSRHASGKRIAGAGLNHNCNNNNCNKNNDDN